MKSIQTFIKQYRIRFMVLLSTIMIALGLLLFLLGNMLANKLSILELGGYLTVITFVVLIIAHFLTASHFNLIEQSFAKSLLMLTNNNGDKGSCVFQEVKDASENIEALQSEELKPGLDLEINQRLYEQAKRLAHDIKSPLLALNQVEAKIEYLPDADRALLRNAIDRIKDITNSLLVAQKTKGEAHSSKTDNVTGIDTFQILPLIESIIFEKKALQFSEGRIDIQFNSSPFEYSCFAKLDRIEFLRTISNIIQNSIESYEATGTVTIKLRQSRNEHHIEIIDEGRGIDPSILPHLGSKSISHGKDGGNGIGLFNAVKTIRSWGGDIDIKSELGKGTHITVKIPAAPYPTWFVPELTINPKRKIVILDDDQSVHGVWDLRFKEIGFPSNQVIHCLNERDFKTFYDTRNNLDACLYLIDLRFSTDDFTGIDLIKKYSIQSDSILVTSYANDSSIQRQCIDAGIRYLSKELVSYIPLKLAVI